MELYVYAFLGVLLFLAFGPVGQWANRDKVKRMERQIYEAHGLIPPQDDAAQPGAEGQGI